VRGAAHRVRPILRRRRRISGAQPMGVSHGIETTIKKPILIVVLLFGLTAMKAQIIGNATPKEQSDFGAEDQNWKHPVPIPEGILEILRKAPGEVLGKLRQGNIGLPEDITSDSLLASEIHLDGLQERDLIVMGVGKLGLPHAALFWVFRQTRTGYEAVLSTGGDSLTVLNTKKNGYRRIRVSNNTASTTTGAIYVFDGRQYKLTGQHTTPIR